jgi:glycosyltransferase involved in cell wall biosynthesis
MPPLVSILIPCYNADRWLAETIESALAQTWENKEIIIVDDGSTDGSLAIARSYESSQVKVITQENQGASTARNVAYQNCAGNYIQYLDADDLLSSDKVDRQLALLTNFPNTIATCEWARFHHTPEEAQFTPQAVWQDFQPVDFLVTTWDQHLMMHPAAWLIPRSIAERVGGWNEELSLNDDGEYFTRVVLASQGIKFCWGAKSYYRSGNLNSLSGTKTRKAWESAFLSLQLGTRNLLATQNTAHTRRVCADVFQRFIYEVYPDVQDLRQQAKMTISELGGSTLQPSCGGIIFQLLSNCFGWQAAKLAQNFAYQHGYREVAIGWKLSRLVQTLSQQSQFANKY